MEDYSMLSHSELGGHMYEVSINNSSCVSIYNLILITIFTLDGRLV